jgi:integrase
MRPGEVCILRGRDVDRASEVWIYTPGLHKTQHHGRARTIAIGPKAQAVLAPFLLAAGDGYVFSPARADAERRAVQRQARRSKVQPSQVARAARRARNPKRKFNPCYDTVSLAHALSRACSAAGVPRWSFNQLRHACATRLRRELGSLEATRVVLGHSSADVTTIYAERDLGLAVETMRKFG